MLVSAAEGYRLWAAEYDSTPNPLLALERRVLEGRMGLTAGDRLLDAGTGTGRWMKHARTRGALTFGVDISAQMLSMGSGNLVRGDIQRLPFADDAFDVVICSMTLGYVRSASTVLRELARVARRIIVSDLHPDAVTAGWTRSFRREGQVYEIEQYRHCLRNLNPPGTRVEWFVASCFGEAERALFCEAGKAGSFDAVCLIPAIWAACWTR
jgi:malonyl-CoA O-methyltransferase